MDRVESCISCLMGKAAQQISRQAREKLAAWGVTPPQYAVLKVLWDNDGQSGAAIGARLVIDSTTITGLIDPLEEAGLLRRRADDGGRRVHRLFLTARGKELQEPLDAAMDQLNAEVKLDLALTLIRRASPELSTSRQVTCWWTSALRIRSAQPQTIWPMRIR